jgi:2'-5' RNA ligase
MRAFIAIDLDQSIKSELSALVSRLARSRAEVRWVKLQGMHLTLKFLGEVSADSEVPRLEKALRAAVQGTEKFELTLSGTGAFPDLRRPRVLWVGVEPCPALDSLQGRVESFLEKEGFLREERPFKPHLTLGRVKGRSGLEAALAELRKNETRTFGSMTVSRLSLFESRLKPDGAEYRVVSEIPIP